MHSFADLIHRSVCFTLHTLNQAQQATCKELEISGATVHIKNLQMLQLQKAIFAVGMFSIFEAHLQQRLNCVNGFKKAQKILLAKNKTDVESRFQRCLSSINALKHGHGRSYEQLLAQKDTLPFKIKSNDEYFFEEGDVSEVDTLIYVDDDFVKECARIIQEVENLVL